MGQPFQFGRGKYHGLSAVLVILVTGAAVLRGAPVPETASGPKFSYRLKKATEDSIDPAFEKDGVTFEIRSKSGIGAGDIRLTEGNWPRQVVLRFRLSSLEHVAVGNGQVTLKGNLSARPKTVLYYGKDGTPVSEERKAAYTLVLIQGEQGIDVIVPANFVTKDTPTINLEWIDAYRQ
jgi:hypothetical protein